MAPFGRTNVNTNPQTKVWVCFRDGTDEFSFGFIGVYTTREKAIAACRDEFDYIEQSYLNEENDGTYQDWVEDFYPHAPDKGVVRR
jgi:hypothetical protein